MALTSARLSAYLALEREMLALDNVGDPVAETLREAMDALWYGLSDEEHALLDDRTVLCVSGPLLTIADGLFQAPTEQPVLTVREGPISVADWQCQVA